MRRNPDSIEQDRAPQADRGRIGRAYPAGESDDDDEEYIGVAHQRSRAATRDENDEDVAEEDIMEILDDDGSTSDGSRPSRS